MDRRAIGEQYGTSANLSARIALHQQCSVNAYGLQRWIFDRLQLQSGQRVLEIACGAGSLWRENLDRLEDVELVLSDISPAMLETTRAIVPSARFVNCALPDLPFASRAFDVVIANHMLYHVADRERGLREIQRVLRPEGVLFASTNGAEHLREIKDLMGAFGIAGGDVSSSFTLENGASQLARVFASVQCEEYEDALRVEDAELLVAYIASMNAQAADVVRARHDEMRARIATPFMIRKSTGLFVARATPAPLDAGR
ncbi:MAG TPA: methyltransferase domain-containing protein [Thermoanaerobaculia bacterium]|nr:methyltransferase domain-containing protein [Thermoanaerobaculia bacterium]